MLDALDPQAAEDRIAAKASRLRPDAPSLADGERAHAYQRMAAKAGLFHGVSLQGCAKRFNAVFSFVVFLSFL
jgi:hypothetical protein